MTDNGGGQGDAECIFTLQGVLTPSAADCNLWNNTVTLRALVFDPAVSSVTFGLRSKGGQWQEMAGSNTGDGTWSATFGAEWEESVNENGQTIYTPKAGTGIWAGSEYECRAVIDGSESLASLTTTAGQTIPGGDMEDGSMSCFNNNHGSFWDSGNNSMSSPLCEQSTYNGMEGNHCARLQANQPIALVKLAAGNLFTGSFNQSGTSGTVSFGQPYDWQARPRMMRVRYYAETLGTVNQNQHSGPLATGSQDQARIYAAIVDWNATHSVTSGSSSPKGGVGSRQGYLRRRQYHRGLRTDHRLRLAADHRTVVGRRDDHDRPAVPLLRHRSQTVGKLHAGHLVRHERLRRLHERLHVECPLRR